MSTVFTLFDEIPPYAHFVKESHKKGCGMTTNLSATFALGSHLLVATLKTGQFL